MSADVVVRKRKLRGSKLFTRVARLAALLKHRFTTRRIYDRECLKRKYGSDDHSDDS